MLALLCIPLQLYAQFFSFESEVAFLREQVVMGDSGWAEYLAYTLAFVFELVKATVIGIGIRQFFLAQSEFAWWAMAGLALSFGSWWMSDQGTATLAQNSVGSSPTDEKSGNITAIYQPQIAGLEKEMLNLERENFWWCSLHRTKHTNAECNAKASGFYINPKERADKLAQAKITELKDRKLEVEAQMNDELAKASNLYLQAVDSHQALLNQTQLSLQTKVLVSEAIIWLTTLALSYILFRLYEEQNAGEETIAGTNPSPENDPHGSRAGHQPNEPQPTGAGVNGRKEALRSDLFPKNKSNGKEAENPCTPAVTACTAAVQPISQTNDGLGEQLVLDWEVHANGHQIHCDECGESAVLIHPGRFCSDACRMAWHKKKRKQVA